MTIKEFLKENRLERKHFTKLMWKKGTILYQNYVQVTQNIPRDITLSRFQEVFKHYWVDISNDDLLKLFK